MFANYHTHTARCGHASGSDREYVEAAIRGGIKILGFSDHCPWIFPDGHVSATRMLPSEFEDYYTSIQSLKKEYADDITIYIGLESEYIPELMAAQDEFLKPYPLDYMILGEHYTRREPLSPFTGRPSDSEADLARYVDLIIEGMNSGRYKYVAHPDVFNFTGEPAIYERHMTRLCRYFKQHDLPVEINMLGALGGRHYPSDRFLRIASATGNTAIIGVDAHTPDRLESVEGENICRRIAERHGLALTNELPELGIRTC